LAKKYIDCGAFGGIPTLYIYPNTVKQNPTNLEINFHKKKKKKKTKKFKKIFKKKKKKKKLN